MKNNLKIFSIILSCLILIGIMAVASSAESDATVGIYKKIISYEGAVRIAYSINAENLADGDEIKVVFSYDEDKTVSLGQLDASEYAYVNGVSAIYEIGGVDYPTVFSNGFAPANLTKTVYATPVIVNAEGDVVAVGEKVDFSVFRYCTERFSANPSEDQLELYTALLGYGAAVQEALLASGAYSQSELDKYGWADAYYVTKVTNKVDGAFDSVTTVCYRNSDVRIEAPKTYNGKMFAGFEDADGTPITMYGEDKTAESWNYYDTVLPLGETAITYNYKTSGKIQTWSDAEGNDLTLGGSGLTHPGSEHSAVSFDKSSDSILSMDVVDGELVLNAPKTSSWRPLELINKNATAGAVGKTYVFETDLKIVDDASTAGTDNVLLQFGFNKRADYGATEETFVLFALNRTSSTSYKLQTLDKTGGDWANLVTGLYFGEYYNLRIEYEIISVGTTSTTPANSTAKGEVKVYIDGELMSTFTSTGFYDNIPNGTFAGVGMLDRAYKGVSTHYYCFDNTYIATE